MSKFHLNGEVELYYNGKLVHHARNLITSVGYDFANEALSRPPVDVTGESIGTGDGTTTAFSFTLANRNAFDIVVTDGTNYAIVRPVNGEEGTGTATFASAPASGATISADYKYWAEGWKMSRIAIGTGTAAPADTDTALGSEVARLSATYSHSSGTNYHTLEAEFSFAASYAITEAGLFNQDSGGTMLARHTFAAINVASGDTLRVTWRISF